MAFLSNFYEWDQKDHSADWLLFPQNIGPYLSIDETSLSQGELYTILTNKEAKGKKGAIVAILKGVDADKIIPVLSTIKEAKRFKVKEITLDMSPTMAKIARKCFPKATQVTDRFHVQQLAYDAVQEMRIAYRWEAIDLENKEIELSRTTKKKYIPDVLENGDTLKQLLARSRYLLFKRESKWTPSQHRRAELLFRYYPSLEEAYRLAMKLGEIYHTVKDKGVGFTRLAKWYDEVEKSGFKSFGVVSRSIQNNYQNILNFFDNRHTNASAESFNAKIKAFRSCFRGVRSIPFFLFRLTNIYA
jgi:transposase